MLTTKNERKAKKWGGGAVCLRFLAVLAFAVALAGCGPPGTHALFKGQKLLNEGDFADAADEFRSATEVMTTNAEAWNYLGVADEHAGQYEEATSAYHRALELDRDLTEAHYNLGCLYLDQNKPDQAVGEFTAYTLRFVNEPEGWLKLGLAQLRLHDLSSAEKSFSTAFHLSPNNAEALNGLGLARMERNKPEEAEKFFQAAVQNHPEYAPAILNLATVEHQYLHNDRQALDYYRQYLALNPRPADWDQVNNIANTIQQSPALAMNVPQQMTPTPPAQQTLPPQNYVAPREQQQTSPQETRTEGARSQESRPQTARNREEKPAEQPEETVPRTQPQTVQVQPEQNVANPPNPSVRPVQEPEMFASVQPTPPKSTDYNPLHWFHSQPAPQTTPPVTQENVRVTPLPPQNSTQYMTPKPVHIVQPAPPVFPRYIYLSPSRPAPGDRRSATAMFEHAHDLEVQRRYTDALDSYRRATRLDPSWFEAQYNCGVLAYRLRDFQFSLNAYEMALAIQPSSSDARYNFAIALKAAGYVTDAVAQLRQILAYEPNNVRAHLELGNVYAQQLYDTAHAREEYLAVLRLDPSNAQASNIQFWLSANPPQ
jgi:tetratricopeptide (TPR) repeat protein